MCSTHNVTSSTIQIMTEEFKKAAEHVDRVMIGKNNWDTLFEKNGKHLLIVIRFFLFI